MYCVIRQVSAKMKYLQSYSKFVVTLFMGCEQ